jgi:hypothetical protein
VFANSAVLHNSSYQELQSTPRRRGRVPLTAEDVLARLGTQDTKIAELSTGIEQIKALLMDRSSTPPNHSHSAVPAGLPIKKAMYNDCEMVTSPIIFTVGSTIYWKYGESLWKDVKIVEAILPSATRVEPVYTFAFGEHRTEQHKKLGNLSPFYLDTLTLLWESSYAESL